MNRWQPLSIAFFVLVIWMTMILGGGILQAGHGSLDKLVTEQLVIAFVLAPIFLYGAIVFLKWDKHELGLKSANNWKLLWLPLVFIVAFISLAVANGLPAKSLIVLALINSILVGISEEFMFRGIFLRSALKQLSVWPALCLTTVVFGGIHTLNGFMTGDFVTALIQAIAAAMSGFWLLAIRLRTRSLYPAMLIHGLWDFSIFLLSVSLAAAATQAADDPAFIQRLLVALAFPLPLFLYGLWLLRGIGKQEPKSVLA